MRICVQPLSLTKCLFASRLASSSSGTFSKVFVFEEYKARRSDFLRAPALEFALANYRESDTLGTCKPYSVYTDGLLAVFVRTL